MDGRLIRITVAVVANGLCSNAVVHRLYQSNWLLQVGIQCKGFSGV